MNSHKCAYRGQIFYFRDSSTFDTIPYSKEVDKGFSKHSYCYIEDGILIINEQGEVSDVGEYADIKKHLHDVKIKVKKLILL